MGTNPNPGDLLIAVVTSIGTSGTAWSNITSVSDSQGDTYTLLGTTLAVYQNFAVYIASGVHGGATTVTEQVGGLVPNGTIRVFEYRNIQPSSPVDAVNASTGFTTSTGIPTTYTPVGTMSITTTQANDLVVAVGFANSSLTITGYTQRTTG